MSEVLYKMAIGNRFGDIGVRDWNRIAEAVEQQLRTSSGALGNPGPSPSFQDDMEIMGRITSVVFFFQASTLSSPITGGFGWSVGDFFQLPWPSPSDWSGCYDPAIAIVTDVDSNGAILDADVIYGGTYFGVVPGPSDVVTGVPEGVADPNDSGLYFDDLGIDPASLPTFNITAMAPLRAAYEFQYVTDSGFGSFSVSGISSGTAVFLPAFEESGNPYVPVDGSVIAKMRKSRGDGILTFKWSTGTILAQITGGSGPSYDWQQVVWTSTTTKANWILSGTTTSTPLVEQNGVTGLTGGTFRAWPQYCQGTPQVAVSVTQYAYKGLPQLQAISILNAVAGTFTLTFDDRSGKQPLTTGALAYNANASAIQTAIQGLLGVWANATVSGSTTATITGASWSNNIATFTASNSFAVSQQITVTGVVSSGGGSYNGNFVVMSASATSFSVALASNPGTWSSGGSAVATNFVVTMPGMNFPVIQADASELTPLMQWQFDAGSAAGGVTTWTVSGNALFTGTAVRYFDATTAIDDSGRLKGWTAGGVFILIDSDNTVSGVNAFVLGNNNSINNDYSVAIGQSNTLDGVHIYAFGTGHNVTGGGFSVAIGNANTLNGLYSTMIGSANATSGALDYSLVAGHNNASLQHAGSGHDTVLGQDNAFGGSGMDYSLVVGYQNTNLQQASSGYNTIIGQQNTFTNDGMDFSLVVGYSNSGQHGLYNTIVGQQNTFSGNMNYSLVLGLANSSLQQGSNGYNAVIGHDNQFSGGADYSLVVGHSNTGIQQASQGYLTVIGQLNQITGGIDQSLVLGYSNTSIQQVNAGYNTVIGQQNQMTSGADHTLIVGFSNTSIKQANDGYNTVIGQQNTFSNGMDYSLVIGYSNSSLQQVSNGRNTVIGQQNNFSGSGMDTSLVIGYANTSLQTSSAGSTTVIGQSNVFSGNMDYSFVAGYGNTSLQQSSSGRNTVIGQQNDFSSSMDHTVIVGDSNTSLQASVGYNTVIGQSNSFGGHSDYSLVIGYTNTGLQQISNGRNTIIGQENSLNSSMDYSAIIGYANTNSSTVVRSFIAGSSNTGIKSSAGSLTLIGQGNSITGSGMDYSVVIGYNNINLQQNQGAYNTVIGENNSSTGAGFDYTLIVGYNNTGWTTLGGDGYLTVIGQSNPGSNLDYSVIVGYSNAVTSQTGDGYNTIVGESHTITSCDFCSAFGYNHTIGNSILGATTIGYKAQTDVNYTINFGGSPIIQNSTFSGATGDDCVWAYSGTETVISSPELDLATTASLTINLPSGCLLFVDEVGIIVTQIGGVVAVAPTVEFGYEGPTAAGLIAAAPSTLFTVTKQRQRFTTLLNYDGHTQITFNVTVAATGTAPVLKARVYFKGLLIQDQ